MRAIVTIGRATEVAATRGNSDAVPKQIAFTSDMNDSTALSRI
jgi:hypothetical protein